MTKVQNRSQIALVSLLLHYFEIFAVTKTQTNTNALSYLVRVYAKCILNIIHDFSFEPVDLDDVHNMYSVLHIILNGHNVLAFLSLLVG